jgi:hypothetical protein
MKPLGLVLIAIGAIWAAVAFNMSTAVTAGGQRIGSGEFSVYVPEVTVNNIGLMEQRRNHLMLAGFTALAGVILFGLGSLRPRETTSAEEGKRQCPYCAEFVRAEAQVCRYCRRELPSLESLAEEAQAARNQLSAITAAGGEAARIAESQLPKGNCPNCEKGIPLASAKCKHCGAVFGEGSTWTVRALTRA